MSRKELTVDEVSLGLARVMKICGWIGLMVMVLFGLVHVVGVRSYLGVVDIVQYVGETRRKILE